MQEVVRLGPDLAERDFRAVAEVSQRRARAAWNYAVCFRRAAYRDRSFATLGAIQAWQ